jgi:integrase
MRKAIKAAGIERTVRPWHDLRHTALTHDAASGNPAVYVQARAGHAQATDDGAVRPRGVGAIVD